MSRKHGFGMPPPLIGKTLKPQVCLIYTRIYHTLTPVTNEKQTLSVEEQIYPGNPTLVVCKRTHILVSCFHLYRLNHLYWSKSQNFDSGIQATVVHTFSKQSLLDGSDIVYVHRERNTKSLFLAALTGTHDVGDTHFVVCNNCIGTINSHKVHIPPIQNTAQAQQNK